MSDVTPEADVAEAGAGLARGPVRSPLGAARRLSDRTPLRTKLITALLALVIMALAAISVASVYMLRGYVTTQRDTALTQALQGLEAQPQMLKRLNPGQAIAQGSGTVLGVQLPGQQLKWEAFTLPNGY